MERTFGDTLRDIRIKKEMGLRELARQIQKSPGYLSDVENGRVPPPSEGVILDIASALGTGLAELLKAARKVHPEVFGYVSQQPEIADFLRLAKDRNFDQNDWQRLAKLVEIVNLGRSKRER